MESCIVSIVSIEKKLGRMVMVNVIGNLKTFYINFVFVWQLFLPSDANIAYKLEIKDQV